MRLKRLLVAILSILTVLSSAVLVTGCGGTKGLAYELTNEDTAYMVVGFEEEVEEIPEIIEVARKYKGKPVVKVGAAAFRNVEDIKVVILPEGLEEINSSAFRGCTNLESINLPSTVNKLGAGAFHSCKKLDSLILPDGITEIPNTFIYGCENIVELSIPEGVTKIGEKAFGKTGIVELDFPDALTEIANGAFREANKLKEVTIGAGIEILSEFVFDGCVALETINLSEGLLAIASYAFNNCSALTYIEIPASVTQIYNNAFNDCTALTGIQLNNVEIEECNTPGCGVNICPSSKALGFTTHYHCSTWKMSENLNPAYVHYHDIYSHDISDPVNAYKLLVTGEVKSMHNYPGGGSLGWSYNEDTGRYLHNNSLDYNDDYTADEAMETWAWNDSTSFTFYNGQKRVWY